MFRQTCLRLVRMFYRKRAIPKIKLDDLSAPSIKFLRILIGSQRIKRVRKRKIREGHEKVRKSQGKVIIWSQKKKKHPK